METKHSYKIGDIIKYRTWTGETRTVRITAKEDNIKHGKSGFDGEIIGGNPSPHFSSVWGYDHQIIDQGTRH